MLKQMLKPFARALIYGQIRIESARPYIVICLRPDAKSAFSNHDDNCGKNDHKFACLTLTNTGFARFARAFFIFCMFDSRFPPINREFTQTRVYTSTATRTSSENVT